MTTRLIAAVEDSALLDDAELDELADSFLSHEHVISYPLVWVSPQWLEVELDGGNGRTYTVDDDTLAQHHPSLLDAAGTIDENRRRRLIRRGLQTAQASVRRTALDRLCALDGPEKARRRARADSNATVREWRPRSQATDRIPTLFSA